VPATVILIHHVPVFPRVKSCVDMASRNLFSDFVSSLSRSTTPPGTPPPSPFLNPQPRHNKRKAEELEQNANMSKENYNQLAAKIDALATTLSDTQDTLAKKMKSRPTLKRRGNQLQINSNLNAMDFMDSVVTFAGAGRCGKVIEAAVQANSILAYRNKLIQMADGSDLGWDLVNAYESNELAESESDERRMKRADSDARAEKKRKSEASKTKGRGRGKPATNENVPQVGQANQACNFAPMQMPYNQAYQYPPMGQPFPASAGHFGPANNGGFFRPNFNRPPPCCYLCGQWGHVQKNCPNVAGGQGNAPAQGSVDKA
jgi:hypothetical protein